MQKLKSAEQGSSEWTRIVSALGPPHFSLAKAWAICRTLSRCCDPLHVTGLVGVAIPTSASTRNSDGEIERHPNVLQYGFALEYSLIYLQEQVKDVGLSAPFDRLIPLVEFSFETPLNRGQSGQTTGTINPGVIWSSKYVQFGVEAVVPINKRTGESVGVIGQVHFYLDDLFPRSLGRPLFGYR